QLRTSLCVGAARGVSQPAGGAAAARTAAHRSIQSCRRPKAGFRHSESGAPLGELLRRADTQWLERPAPGDDLVEQRIEFRDVPLVRFEQREVFEVGY